MLPKAFHLLIALYFKDDIFLVYSAFTILKKNTVKLNSQPCVHCTYEQLIAISSGMDPKSLVI